ncbi:hypothetical protein [Frigidibacter sp. ROC022]|uniref:hypothetical protein n=1 Tax=Frigidibacter sp. ROC022 TaxID=2971796 RepID=UPI00215B7609|nr:hypothetical protein [Frigidibacter sp. ROC022]MCR8723431.1 hypothetical protein [Frigidibacter sp. ROC022]
MTAKPIGRLRGTVTGIVGGIALLTAAQAVAEPLNGRAAGRALFSARTSAVEIVKDSGLSAADQAILGTLFKLKEKDLALLDQLPGISAADRESAKAVFSQFKESHYYGAVAAAPGDGLVAPATQIAQNLHSPEAARAAALAACAKLAQSPCVVVAEVLPRRYKPKPLTLSQSATEGFATYKKGKGPKALAISASTDAWAVARGIGAKIGARRECERLAEMKGADDCTVVIADD